MRTNIKRSLIVLAGLFMALAFGPVSVSAAEMPSVTYQTHVQNVGWQDYVAEGKMSGTEGLSYRLEGIRIALDDAGYDLGIQYQTHIQNIGWEEEAGRGWKTGKQMSGTEGLSYRLEAIQIKLTGADADKFDIFYQVHAQNMGWLGWAKNGESAGTAAYGYRLEGIKIVIVPAGEDAPKGIINKEEPFYQDYLASYASILNEYKVLDTTNQYDKNTMPHVNVELRNEMNTGYRGGIKIHYLLEDLSGDFIPELIISDFVDVRGGEYKIYDTYKLVNGKPEPIFDTYSMGHRSFFYICENQTIRNQANGGIGYTELYYYYLDGINQKLVFQVIHDRDNNPEYYTIDVNNKKTAITQDQFIDYMNYKNNYEPVRTDLNWIKL